MSEDFVDMRHATHDYANRYLYGPTMRQCQSERLGYILLTPKVPPYQFATDRLGCPIFQEAERCK